MLEEMGKVSMEVDGRTYYHKPIHVLRPKNLESMTISLKDATAQKRYFELGLADAEGVRRQVVQVSLGSTSVTGRRRMPRRVHRRMSNPLDSQIKCST